MVISDKAPPDQRLQLSGDEAGTAPEDRSFVPTSRVSALSRSCSSYCFTLMSRD